MSVLLRYKSVVLVLGMVLFCLPLAARSIENSTDSESQESELPTPDDRGNYQPASPVHLTWAIVDRGLSGLNCYQTFPPNSGSNIVVSRLFSRQILETMPTDDTEEGKEVWVESSGKTWLSVRDPWSGQACWVRAHEDFIKPIEADSDSIQKSLDF
ncbi:MAG TPA: hypothetical protein IGS17_02180 [Oscillatoriales cyanobacterium M59_W2019_021]|nr:hypothetical protein [Oscillatoriales cyanobacterium M4454_W2019_049]HIK49723.1 hypothetical protein [Oscillatoriales cyanobacterium M59_W2019_021]